MANSRRGSSESHRPTRSQFSPHEPLVSEGRATGGLDAEIGGLAGARPSEVHGHKAHEERTPANALPAHSGLSYCNSPNPRLGSP